MVASLAAAVILRGAALLLWGRDPLRADPITAGNLPVASQSDAVGRAVEAGVLVVGAGELADELLRELRKRAIACVHLRRPADRILTRSVRGGPRSVAIKAAGKTSKWVLAPGADPRGSTA